MKRKKKNESNLSHQQDSKQLNQYVYHLSSLAVTKKPWLTYASYTGLATHLVCLYLYHKEKNAPPPEPFVYFLIRLFPGIVAYQPLISLILCVVIPYRVKNTFSMSIELQQNDESIRHSEQKITMANQITSSYQLHATHSSDFSDFIGENLFSSMLMVASMIMHCSMGMDQAFSFDKLFRIVIGLMTFIHQYWFVLKNGMFNKKYPEFLKRIESDLKETFHISMSQGQIIGKYAELIFETKGEVVAEKKGLYPAVFQNILQQVCLHMRMGFSVLSPEKMMVLYESNLKLDEPGKNDFFDYLRAALLKEAKIAYALTECQKVLQSFETMLNHGKSGAGRDLFFDEIKLKPVTCYADDGTLHASLTANLPANALKQRGLLGAMNIITDGVAHISESKDSRHLVIVVTENAHLWKDSTKRLNAMKEFKTCLPSAMNIFETKSTISSSEVLASTSSSTSTDRKPIPLGKSALRFLADMANYTAAKKTTAKVEELKTVYWQNGVVYDSIKEKTLVRHWEYNRYIEWAVGQDSKLQPLQYEHYQRLALHDQTENICHIGSVEGIAVYKLRQGGTNLRVWGCVVSEPNEPMLIRFFKVADHDKTKGAKKFAFMRQLVEQFRNKPKEPLNNSVAHSVLAPT